MTTPLTPTGIKVQGAMKVTFAPTGSLTAPSLAVMTGVTALDVSNILHADAWSPTKETAKGTAPPRLGTTVQWEQSGRDSHSLGDLSYVIDPQGAAASDGKLAFEKFVPGTTGFFYERPGGSTDVDFAVGDWVRVIPVKLLAQNIAGDPTDEFAEFKVTQSVIVTAPGIGALVQVVA